MAFTDHLVTTMEQLEGMYGEVYPPARVKEIDHINADYRTEEKASPSGSVAPGSPGWQVSTIAPGSSSRSRSE